MPPDDGHLIWPFVRNEKEEDFRVFVARVKVARHPQSKEEHRFAVLAGADWTNVIAVTEDDAVVLIRQFRHGTDRVTLEIPGGAVDTGETHRQAAARELLEETGYAADKWTQLGSVHPNPALQNNLCTTWLAQGAVQIAQPRLDEGESIEVKTVALSDIRPLIAQGAITHALVIAAFFFLFEAPA